MSFSEKKDILHPTWLLVGGVSTTKSFYAKNLEEEGGGLEERKSGPRLR